MEEREGIWRRGRGYGGEGGGKEGRQDQRGEDRRREGEEKGTLHVDGNSETLCSPHM